MVESQSKSMKNKIKGVKFTTRQIKSLIEICRAGGIGSFAYGDLSFTFLPNLPSLPPKVKPSDAGQDDLSDDFRDDYLQNLMITNPLEYEKVMMSDAGEYDGEENAR